MTNPLYPVFLKLHRLQLLIVGAGEVGYEKLSFILKSSPAANIIVVAPWVNPAITELLDRHPAHRVRIEQRPFVAADVEAVDLVIAATNLPELNRQVRDEAKAAGKLVNVADTPALCDFYLGSIVTRGPVKIGISTNGQSPTFAKRLRQLLEQALPEGDTESLLDRLHELRDTLGPDFAERVRRLNEATAQLLENQKTQEHA